MNNIKLLSIGSTARVGKDSLAKSLFTLLVQDGYNARIYSLANALKQDCADFLQNNFGYDVWTDDTEEKKKFRDFLVLYGKMHRQQSKGTYWTNIVEQKIKEDASIINADNRLPFVAIVPDVRYADPIYPHDEVWWVQKKMNGVLINLDRIDNGVRILPANLDEEINYGRIKPIADYLFEWETLKGPLEFTNTFNGEIFEQVTPLYNKIKSEYLQYFHAFYPIGQSEVT